MSDEALEGLDAAWPAPAGGSVPLGVRRRAWWPPVRTTCDPDLAASISPPQSHSARSRSPRPGATGERAGRSDRPSKQVPAASARGDHGLGYRLTPERPAGL
jgi:hypothetical protein